MGRRTPADAARPRAPRKRPLYVLLVAAITAGLLAYALWDVDTGELANLLARARYALVLPFLLAVTAFYLLKARRWSAILHPLGHYSLRQVAPAMMMGFAANNVLPAHLGEIVRGVLFARQHEVPVSGVLVTLVLERMLDALAILALYVVAVAWIHDAPEALRMSVWIVAVVLVLAVAVVVAMLAAPQLVFRLWHALAGWLPPALEVRGRALLETAMLALSSVRSTARLAGLAVNSIAQWTLQAGAVWLSLLAFGESVSAAAAVVVLTVTTLAVALPSAPGYVGAIQAAFVFALQPFGVPDAIAFAASVFYLVCQWVPVTAVGALYAMRFGVRLGGVHEARRGRGDHE